MSEKEVDLQFESMFIVMDDEIEIKKLPLFLRDIKHLRREHRSVIEIAEEIAGIIKQM